MFLSFGVPTVHLQRTYMLLSFRYAPLREWERQKENLIAFMEEANRLLLLVHACLCQVPHQPFLVQVDAKTIMFFINFFLLL